MSDPQESSWVLGSYGVLFFDLFMKDVARSLGDLTQSLIGDSEFDKSDVVLAVAEEASTRLCSLPKGVSFRIPGNYSLDGKLLETPMYISVDPLDVGYGDVSTTLKTSVNIAVQVGDDVVAVYVMDVMRSVLYGISPEASVISVSGVAGPEQTTLEPEKRRHGNFVALQDESGHEPLLQLLGDVGDDPIETVVVRQSQALSLIDVIRGIAVAYARPGGELTAPWEDLPLLGLARVGGVKVFRVDDACLREVPLTPSAYGDGVTELGRPSMHRDGVYPREHGLLYVSSGFVPVLQRRAPVRLLGE